jgi:hypothetical protein
MRIVPGAIAASVLALVTAAGCEVAIGDALPAFTCTPNAAEAVCPPGQVCVGSQCVPIDGGVEAAESGTDVMLDRSAWDSPPGDGPSPDSGACRTFGCKCGGQADCDSLLCVDKVAVTGALFAAAGSYSFCSQPCCTSSDCPAGSVCFGTDAGGNYCVKPAWLGDRSQSLGTGLGGQPCSTGADCRSGLCPAADSSHCADTCCSTMSAASECSGAPNTTCVYKNFPGTGFDVNFTANCAVANPGGLPPGRLCGQNSDCASNLCSGSCLAACRNSSNCNSALDVCWYLFLLSTSQLVSACSQHDGTAVPGAPCPGGMRDCGNDLCVGGTCTDVCYSDKDCAGVPGLPHCLPALLTVSGGGSVEAPICSK